MNQSFKAVAYPAAIAASVVLFAIMPPWRQGDASAAAAAAQSTLAPSTVSVGGVTLRSVNVDIPNRDRQFEGPGADVVNDNCLTCHSAGMVLTQPRLPRADWQAEVEKMRNTYKGPIDAKDVPAIVETISQTSLTNQRPRLPSASVSRPPSTAVKTRADGFEAAFV